MISGYHIWTLSHKTSCLKSVGRHALEPDPDHRSQILNDRKRALGADELMYVQTCNRIIYLAFSNAPLCEEKGRDILFPTEESERPNTAFYRGKDAVCHFFQVASSIDSMVVGEREITGQLKSFYQESREAGLTGDHIRILKECAVVAAKDVFSRTRIGEKPVSVVSLAFQTILSAGVPQDARIVLIGAGDTIGLVCKFLRKYGYDNISIFNRTLSKAERLAKKVDGKAYSLKHLRKFGRGFDVLISCTAASSVLLTREYITEMMSDDEHTKWIIDLAVPRDCDSTLAKMDRIRYVHVADLKDRARQNMKMRKREVEKAQDMLLEHIDAFEIKHRQRQVVRALGDIPKEIKDIKHRALNDVFNRDLEQLDPSTRQLVEHMMDYMEKKCIGIPMKTAREAFSPSEQG